MNEEILDLGFLDVNIYSCISSQIDTDRVVITDKQLDHIADHHPEAYDETLIELKSILASPDYIFKDDNHIDTGLVVKAIRSADSYFYIVVKVCTNSNGGKFANSVISGWTISERRLKNYLRNKTILYKK
ncbi:MAG: PBECR2 nuclease fold domain-containing protein [Agathobacter sp.]|nr:PBECR2 nuclease fold domain-containing protein [Agathobacter sp.]